MIDSPLRPSLGGQHATPSKEKAHNIEIDGEENNPQNARQAVELGERRLSVKRSKPEMFSPNQNMSLLDTTPNKRSRPMQDPEVGSDCDTEVSVSARREWLKHFGKQQKSNLPRKATAAPQPPATRPHHVKFSAASPSKHTPTKPTHPADPSASTASAASVLVSRMMLSEPPKKSFTPAAPTFKPRKKAVEASNDGYASVAKLSAWLANDPTSTKKMKHVRRGKNVITKSRKFEKDMENVIIIENNISRGGVQNRKKWLEDCSHGEEDGSDLAMLKKKTIVSRCAKSEAGIGDSASCISVSDKKDWLKRAFKNVTEESRNEPGEPARSEIVVDDAASCLSVSDKKDWFKSAFKKGGEGTPSKKPGYARAMTDVMHNRRDNGAASAAKQRFLERSRHTPTKRTPQSKIGANRGLISPPAQPATTRARNVDEGKRATPQAPVPSQPTEATIESKIEAPVRATDEEKRTPPLALAPVILPMVSHSGSVVEPVQEQNNNAQRSLPVRDTNEDKRTPPLALAPVILPMVSRSGSAVEPVQEQNNTVQRSLPVRDTNEEKRTGPPALAPVILPMVSHSGSAAEPVEEQNNTVQRSFPVRDTNEEKRTGPPALAPVILPMVSHSGSAVEPVEEQNNAAQRSFPVRGTNEERRTGPPALAPVILPMVSRSGSAVEPVKEQNTLSQSSSSNTEDDKTPFDFRAARLALIQRGKQNGHKMQVVNKVFMRKAKFEKIEKDYHRRSSAYGLLKPSWEEADGSTGLPSDSYDKKFVSDIAPKKSFEELP